MPDDTFSLFADVILPLALPHHYTYGIPPAMAVDVTPGKRVVVQFGRQKLYSALVRRVHADKPAAYDAKPVLSVIDTAPLVNDTQFALWEWVADYYMCTAGEVMAAALPAALKLESETRLVIHPAFDKDLSRLDAKEYAVAEALERNEELSLKDIARITGRRNVIPLVKQMMEKQIVSDREELEKDFIPDTIEFVRLHPDAGDAVLEEALNTMEKKAPRQFHLMMTFLKMQQGDAGEAILRQKLLRAAGCSSAILHQLEKKELLVVESTESTPSLSDTATPGRKATLTAPQQAALDDIDRQAQEKKVLLLHGVTSSGKTEIYIHLIDRALSEGRQVLYLLPEIALTTQIIARLKKHFGDRLLVYHSRFSERQRAAVWSAMKPAGAAETGMVVVGARSAVLLPFSNLGLVLVDEEHDPSYKQVDPAPRYHARDTAVVLAASMDALTVLGSATPSLESYFNADSGKYGLVTLTTRYADIRMPSVEIVDLADAIRRRKMKSFFSETLLTAIGEALDHRRQVILFQNRRGFSPYLQCHNCHWVPHCVNCDVSLTLHKKRHQLICHYCGYAIPVPAKCGACQDHDLRMHGYGTERIEDEIALYFPGRTVARLDFDSTRSRQSYRKIIQDFESGETDILAGTQMVTKGLDFDNVDLVGILNADNQLNFPDFRAYERSFQLMLQVAGRSGRKHRQGRVIIQTRQPDHPIIRFVKENDFEGFYAFELGERHRFRYPPYCRIIQIRIKHRKEEVAEQKALAFTGELRQMLGKRVSGPVIPHIPRIRNLYQRTILIKAERNLPARTLRSKLHAAVDFFKQNPDNRSVLVQIDVDPV